MADNVPGFREQAKMAASHVQSTLGDAEKRSALTTEVTKHATELANLAKSHLTEAEKRSKLFEFAKGFAAQAISAAQDPAQRQALLDKVNYTSATLFECVKDPSKRQEVHDTLAAATHKLLLAATAATPGASKPEAENPALAAAVAAATDASAATTVELQAPSTNLS